MRRLGLVVVALALVVPLTVSARIQPRTLKGPVPSWWTNELRGLVRAAGAKGLRLPQDVSRSIPVSSLAFLGIRPGQLLLIDNVKARTTSLCTSNFVFTSGSATTAKREKKGVAAAAPNYFIGTAGHCGLVGDPVTMIFAPLGLVEIGTIVKSRSSANNVGAVDFALISINPALAQYVSPSMAHWGGPTGAFTGSGVQIVQHTGWGLVVGTGGTPRAGVAYEWNRQAEWRFEGVIAPGDSGSGAIVAGGLAAGNITHIAVDTGETVPAWNGGTTITSILSYIGSGYTLATCSLAVPWPLPGCPPA
jgi:hypothetical protein